MQAWPSGKRAAHLLLGGCPLLLLCDPLRHAIESRMLLHMLLEFPLLLASGWVVSSRVRTEAAGLDAHGLLGITVALCVSALWMVPVALDLSLLSAPVQCGKVASWWLCGAVLARSWPRLSSEAIVFLLGNLAWMWATAGLLYQDAEQRLCVNYPIDDQLWTGRALVALALLLGAAALFAMARPGATQAQIQPGVPVV